MTRARARALETKVASLLSQLPFESHETWLLPQTKKLFILRYQGTSHGEAKEQVRTREESEHEDGEQRRQVSGYPDDLDEVSDDSDPHLDDLAEVPEDNNSLLNEAESFGPSTRSSGPSWMSGPSPEHSGQQRPRRHSRTIRMRTRIIRTLRACMNWAEAHVPLSIPRLYILLLHLHFRVRKGVAQDRDRSLLIHLPLPWRSRPPCEKIPTWIQDPF